MSSVKYSIAEQELASSILCTNAGDEDLKALVIPCLQAYGEIYTAESGSEALLRYCAQRPYIVVAALDAGDMSGSELCGRIRATDAEALIILIGRERGESVYRCAMEAGAIRYVEMDGNATNTLTSIVNELYERSESQRLQRKVTASHRQQAETLQNLPIPVALLSNIGELLAVNRAFKKSLGIEDAPLPVTLADALDLLPAEPPTGWCNLLEASAQCKGWSGMVTCRQTNKSKAYVQATLSSFHPEQSTSICYQILSMNDITTSEERQAHISIQRESAFEILALLNDTQNCLVSIKDSLSQSSPDANSKICHELTQKLSDCLDDMEDTRQLRQFLTLPSVAHRFSLRASVALVMESISGRLQAHSKEIRSTIPPYLPDMFVGNQRAVHRVLSSLLTNSLENGEGDELCLKIDLKEKSRFGTLIQFVIEFRNSHVAVNSYDSMKDFVAGMKQVDDTKRLHLTGLSLAIALVEKMGGMLWVKSVITKGYSYCFSISLVESAAVDAAGVNDDRIADTALPQTIGNRFGILDSAQLAYPVVRPRILLADDNEVDRLTICRLLESMDCEVFSVSNGREAVDAFDASSYDLMFMDILMPEMDGFEATRLIREKERSVGGRHTPIIALTAYSLKAINEKCVRVGMDSYLHKPVSVRDIMKVLQMVNPVELVNDSTLSALELADLPRIDVQSALNNLGNNIELYQEIVNLYVANVTFVYRDLVTAICTDSLTEVLQYAHKIKGMSSNVGAKRYEELARQIEDAASQGNLGDSTQWLNRLSEEFPQLLDALAAIKWEELR